MIYFLICIVCKVIYYQNCIINTKIIFKPFFVFVKNESDMLSKNCLFSSSSFFSRQTTTGRMSNVDSKQKMVTSTDAKCYFEVACVIMGLFGPAILS